MRNFDLAKKIIGGTALGAGLLSAPVYLAHRGSKALEFGRQETPEFETGSALMPGGTTKNPKDVIRKRSPEEQDRYRRYFEMLREAPHKELGEKVVTAADSFIEKRAALQSGQVKDAGLWDSIKGIFSATAREANLAKSLAATARRVQNVAAQTGLQPQMVAALQQGAGAAAHEGLISKLFSPKGMLIGGTLMLDVIRGVPVSPGAPRGGEATAGQVRPRRSRTTGGRN